MNIPIILTVSRLLLLPVILVLMYGDSVMGRWIAFILFLSALFTDILDGYIARKETQVTALGTYLDHVIDKIFALSFFICLYDIRLIPLWMVLVFLFRELFTSAIRDAAASKGKVVGANWMGKTKMTMQCITIGTAMVLRAAGLSCGIVYFMALITLVFSLVFAAIFVYNNRKLLKD